MSVALAQRRVVIPAVRLAPRETLVSTAPFYLQGAGVAPAALPVRQTSPPLLSFEGPSFMDDFLQVAAGGGRAALPPLLAWRDWAEPPAGMLDAGGAPRYPASIVRAAPLNVVSEAETPGTMDADGVPHGSPAWLRKLYLPVHLRFGLVAFDILCLRAGWPPLDRTRVTAAGAVVRRLVRDAGSERWEDWLTQDGKTGLWFELHGGLPADPAAIPASAYLDSAGQPQDASIAARLGAPAPTVAAPLKLSLDSAKLTLLPAQAGPPRCSLYGLLSVFSSAQQVGDDTPGLTEAQMALAFHDHAVADLTAAWADDAGLRSRLGPALQTLLDRTILPSALANRQGAINVIAAASLATQADILSYVPAVAKAALAACLTKLKPGAGDANPVTSVDAFWSSAGAASASTGVAMSLSLDFTRASCATEWNVLAVGYLRDQAAAALTTTGARSGDIDTATRLLALALIRLRTQRLALTARLQQLTTGSSNAAQLTLVQPQTVGGVSYNLPVATAGELAAEIEAILALDKVRAPPDEAPAWPPLDLTSAADQLALGAHQAALAIEDMLEPIDAAGAGGGSAFDAQVQTKTAAAASDLATKFSLGGGDPVQRLLETGLDIQAQPGRGLLVFPGPAPQASVFSSMTTAVATSYAAGSTATRQEARARVQAHRLRYDHDSLYAVWCWVRIAGRNPCELEQLLWTGRTEPFSIAEPTDVLGARPVTIQLPDLAKLIRDIPRIAKARAKPFAAFNTPPNSSYVVGADPQDTRRAWGVAWICSFGIPVVTICAFILFSIIFSILVILPGFTWMLLLKFCLPVPVPKKS